MHIFCFEVDVYEKMNWQLGQRQAINFGFVRAEKSLCSHGSLPWLSNAGEVWIEKPCFCNKYCAVYKGTRVVQPNKVCVLSRRFHALRVKILL